MRHGERGIVRLIRALLTCWLLASVLPVPLAGTWAEQAGAPRDTVSWQGPDTASARPSSERVAERTSSLARQREATERRRETTERRRETTAPSPLVLAVLLGAEASRASAAYAGRAPERDQRHLYLEQLSLLC